MIFLLLRSGRSISRSTTSSSTNNSGIVIDGCSNFGNERDDSTTFVSRQKSHPFPDKSKFPQRNFNLEVPPIWREEIRTNAWRNFNLEVPPIWREEIRTNAWRNFNLEVPPIWREEIQTLSVHRRFQLMEWVGSSPSGAIAARRITVGLWKGAGGRKRKKREKWGAKRPAKKEKSERTIEGFFHTSTMNHEGITLVGKDIGVLPLRFRTQYFARY